LKFLPEIQTLEAHYDIVFAVCAYNQLLIVGHETNSPKFGGNQRYVALKQICIDNVAEDLKCIDVGDQNLIFGGSLGVGYICHLS